MARPAGASQSGAPTVPRPAGMGEAGGRAPLWGCARGVGIEKSVEVRAGIKAIRYSQKSVGLDVALRLKKEVSSVDKRRIEKPFSTSGFGSEDKPSDAALPPAPKSNEPNRMSRLGPSVKFVSQQMAAQQKRSQPRFL